MAKPSNYWDKRAIKRLTDAEKQSEEYIKRIQKMYDQANRNIQRDIENIYRNYSKDTGLDVQSLKTLLTKHETLKLWDELKARGLDKYVKGNYKARISRLEKLQAQIYAKAKELYPEEQKAHTECYKGIINDSYYKAIYDTQMGTGFDFAFSNLDDNMVTALLNERWSGKNYSQRIWGNTDILAEALSEVIGGAMLSGQSMAKTSKQIRDRFNVGKYYAERLVRTETNHFNNEADAMAYEEMDVDKYVFLATLDTRTSTICQNLDNKVFDLKDRQVGVNYPPMHPNCRSKTRAYMGEEIEKTLKRRARNPVTGKNEVIDNISYSEWAEKHGIESGSTTEKLNKLKAKQNSRGFSAKVSGKGVPLHDEPILLKVIDYNDKTAVNEVLTNFEKSAITDTVETACVITRDGKVYKCFGIKDRVFADFDLGEELRGATMSHNHPITETSFSFSEDDMESFIDYELDVLRGCDKKYTYQFTRNAQDIDEILDDWDTEENYCHCKIIDLAETKGIGYRRWKNE